MFLKVEIFSPKSLGFDINYDIEKISTDDIVFF